jgi:AraC-like DNA-binding protein
MRVASEGVNAATRSLRTRAGVGLAANVVQQSTLRLSSVVVDNPALVLLRHGRKTLRAGTRTWRADAGDAIVVAGGQRLDIENRLSADGLFEARWVVWDATLVAHAQARLPGPRELSDVAVLRRVPADFVSAVDRAVEAIDDTAALPDAIAAHRLGELLVWLAELGIRVASGRQASTSARLRAMIAAAPASRWSLAAAADRVATSETTLRRRLDAEGTRFNAVLTDARMSLALTLLQSTDRAVAAIAAEVGYESASRFAIRFRSRYGFAPSVVRGHER